MITSVFKSAITDADGDIDSGYLAIYWTMFAILGALPVLLIMGVIAVFKHSEKAAEIVQSTGIAIGACCTGLGVVIGAVGAFRAGDKPRPVHTVSTNTKPDVVVNATVNKE